MKKETSKVSQPTTKCDRGTEVCVGICIILFTAKQQKVHWEKELKIACDIPWLTAVIPVITAAFSANTHSQVHYAFVSETQCKSSSCSSQKWITKQIKGTEGWHLNELTNPKTPQAGDIKGHFERAFCERPRLYIHVPLPWLIIEQADTLCHFPWLSVNYWCMAQYNGPIWSELHLHWCQD